MTAGELARVAAGSAAGAVLLWFLLHLGWPLPVMLSTRYLGELLITYFYTLFFFALARRPVPAFWLWIATICNLQWIAQWIPLAIPGTAAHWVLWRIYWEPHTLFFWNCIRVVGYLSTAAAFWPVWKFPRGETKHRR